MDINLYAMVRNNPISHVDKDGRIRFRWHGNWCGPGWTGGQNQDADNYDWDNDPRPAVQDSLDVCCMMHDACYARRIFVRVPSSPRGYRWMRNLDPWNAAEQDACDDALCECAKIVSGGGARRGIICVFCD